MSTDNAAVAAPVETPNAVEAAKPKVAAKKSPAKTTKPKPATKTSRKPVVSKTAKTREIGDTDLSVAERREKLVKTMIKAGATGPTTARTADDLASKSGFTRFDVYGLLYHSNELQKSGYAKQVQIEGVRGLSYHLTAKGAKGYEAK